MPNQSTMLPKHVFISYPRSQRRSAESFVGAVRAQGLVAWIDDESIAPGTSDWEVSIREAITSALAIVLVAAPETVNSSYIPAELKLAQDMDCPIVPAWVSGERWLDCVPLFLANMQYIDCRADRFDDGTKRLVAQLKEIAAKNLPKLAMVRTLQECPPGFMPILISKDEGEPLDLYTAGQVVDCELSFREPLRDTLQIVAVSIHAYSSFERLLDDIYLKYLRPRYSEYTYGRDWVLARPSNYVSLLGLPWEWLRHGRARSLIDVVDGYLTRSTPLYSYGIGSGGHFSPVWAVVEKGFDSASGLWTSSDRVFTQVVNEHPKSLSFTLRRCLNLKPQQPSSAALPTGAYRLDQLDPRNFAHKLIVVADRFVDLPPGVLIVNDLPYGE